MSVREAGIGDVAQVSAALADAFANEPMMRWMIPNERRRDTRLRRLFALEIEHFVLPAGRVLTTDDFRGASFELPPGKWKMAMPLSAALGLVPALGLRLNRGIRFQTFASRHHLEEPHYYVRYIGVATRFQGQGVGAALLRATLDRCDREGMPAYIEASTERSTALYERLGFVHLGRLQVPDGPSFWPMRRPPEQKQVEAGPEAIVKNFDKPVARIVPDSAAKPKRTYE
jgi:GNAT superfamily N-acetyltransferase